MTQALFLQGTPNPQPSFFLVAAAVRLSHSIGLHKKGSGFNLNAVEVEQRKRVFWIAYMLDKKCVRYHLVGMLSLISTAYACDPVDHRYKMTTT